MCGGWQPQHGSVSELPAPCWQYTSASRIEPGGPGSQGCMHPPKLSGVASPGLRLSRRPRAWETTTIEKSAPSPSVADTLTACSVGIYTGRRRSQLPRFAVLWPNRARREGLEMNYQAMLCITPTSVVATGIVLTFRIPRVLRLLHLRAARHRAKPDGKTRFLGGPNRSRLTTSWRLLVVLGSLFVVGCAQVPEAAPQPVRCTGTSNHHDGDTFTCAPEQGSKFVVRVASIDAPETGQAYWRVARARLRELAAPGSMVDCYKVDRYDRRICRLKTKDGKDAADIMLSDGLAWYPESYGGEDAPADRERYRRLQGAAEAAKRGLWVEPNPTSPMTCRQRRRDGLRC